MRLMDVAAARKLLHVGRGADEATIKRAYRTQVREHHPDVGGDPETFVRIQQAYDLLRASPAEQARRQTAPSDSDMEARYQALLRDAEQRAAQAQRAAQEATRRARALPGARRPTRSRTASLPSSTTLSRRPTSSWGSCSTEPSRPGNGLPRPGAR